MRLLLSILALGLLSSCSTDNNGNTTVIPLAPTNLTAAVISTTQVDLQWTDNSTNETGYKVERKLVGGNFAEVASTGANIATYTDLNLTPNTTYVYRVVAYNSAGNSLQYSNEDTVVTTLDTMPSSLNNGLIGYYPFNGNANDESGNGNNGTANGATLTTDRFGNTDKAYSFDGISNYIDLYSSNSILNTINGLQKFSLSYWAYIPTNSNGTIWGHWSNNNGGVGTNCGFIAGFINGSGFYASNSAGCCYFIQPSYSSLNNWAHVTYVFDGTQSINSNIIRIYVNNELITTQSGGVANTTIGNGTSLFIGRRNIDFNNYGDYFLGNLDDIRIYNRALTQAEITYLATH